MMPTVTKWIKKDWIALIVLCTCSLVLYFPIFSNTFLADDYRVLNRVGLQGRILIDGFFRPLSDISIYFNYLIGRLAPFNYYLTNALIHGCTAYLLWMFCYRGANLFVKDNHLLFAWVSALLFVTFPFHNESIAWIVGRGSLLATFFAAICLVTVVSELSLKAKLIVSSVCYFIGLLAYESIFPLPLIVLILIRVNAKSKQTVVKWMIMFLITLFIHFLIRKLFSGVIAGSYGETAFSLNPLQWLTNFLKSFGRLLLPPSDNSMLLIILFAAGGLAYMGLLYYNYYNGRYRPRFSDPQNVVLCLLVVALIIPASFPLSTRTTEGERLLYFPSFFLVIFLTSLFFQTIQSVTSRLIIILLLLTYNIVYLEKSNSHWKFASGVATHFLDQLTHKFIPGKQVVFVNLPGEINGSYIFRNALEEAMLVKGLDTAGIRIVNYINNAEYHLLPKKIAPVVVGDSVQIGNTITIRSNRLYFVPFENSQEEKQNLSLTQGVELWYWNKKELDIYIPTVKQIKMRDE